MPSTISPMQMLQRVSSKMTRSREVPQIKLPEKKRVSFSHKVKVRSTDHVHDFTIEEIDAYWYDEDEILAIRRDMKKTIKWMEAGVSTDSSSDSFCAIGLESYSKSGARCRLRNRKNGWKVVFEEQASQRQQSIKNPQSLAEIYKKQAEDSRVTAAVSARLLYDELSRSLLSGEQRWECKQQSLRISQHSIATRYLY